MLAIRCIHAAQMAACYGKMLQVLLITLEGMHSGGGGWGGRHNGYTSTRGHPAAAALKKWDDSLTGRTAHYHGFQLTQSSTGFITTESWTYGKALARLLAACEMTTSAHTAA